MGKGRLGSTYLRASNAYIQLHSVSHNVRTIISSPSHLFFLWLKPKIQWNLLQTSEGRDQLYDAFTTIVSKEPLFGLLMVPPFSFNYTEGTTSATPAWRSSLWHVCHVLSLVSRMLLLMFRKVWGWIAMGLQCYQRGKASCIWVSSRNSTWTWVCHRLLIIWQWSSALVRLLAMRLVWLSRL